MSCDLVIRNGTVVDGSGAPAFLGDVGITDGIITEVGRVTERGREEIDARGLVVSPGFVDGHTHMDAQVLWDPLGSPSCWHGVTTVVMGNCGFTLAPVRPGEEDLVVGNLERAEDISEVALRAGIDWSWQSFPEYLDAIERTPKAINYATQVGHSALRTWAMGADAFEREADTEELAAMQRALREALAAGAYGFTTSRSPNHETTRNGPVASRYANWSEVVALVDTMSGTGGGVFELSQEEAAHSSDPDVRGEYQRRLAALAHVPGVSVAYGVGGGRQLPFLDATVRAGGRMFGLSHSRGIQVLLSFRTRLPFDKLPEWQAVRAEPLDRQRGLLRDPEVRARLIRAAHGGDYGRAIGAEPRMPNYEQIRVLQQPLPPNPTVAELARARGCDPVEVFLDLALETDFAQFFAQPLSGTDDRDLLDVLRNPNSVMTFSDAGAHVSQICDASIQTHLLGHWVRDRQAFTLEEAVRMISHVPAAAWSIADRGLLRVGYRADVNVFDPATIAPALPTIVHDLPAGERRLEQRAVGIAATVVNGAVVFRDGIHTVAHSGQLLRRSR